MKATLSFSLPNEASEFNYAVNAETAFWGLDDILEQIREHKKYGLFSTVTDENEALCALLNRIEELAREAKKSLPE